MKIVIEHHGDQFNIGLASKEGTQPFIVIKGCRIVDGNKGRFISFPAKKLDSGKWWNHVYATEHFVEHALKAYDESLPKKSKAPTPADDDVPW